MPVPELSELAKFVLRRRSQKLNDLRMRIHMDRKHIEQTIRATWKDAPDAYLDQASRDESLRQIERDVAADMLRERESAKNIAQAEAAKQQRLEARAAAKESVDDSQDRPALSAATGQRRGSERPSRNQPFAEHFADILRTAGHVATARPTQRVQGREVIDGWVVNVRDNENEAGVVAVWWGRAHFSCYFEMNGHADRTAEAAALMVAVLDILKSEPETED